MSCVLNIGSINVDLVWSVPHIVRPGETLAARGIRRLAGGKGANQSVALARAGARVSHAGRVGEEGRWILDLLARSGVDVASIVVDPDERTGSALIQVGDDGENAILVDAGANASLDVSQVEAALAAHATGDVLLLQNEVNDIPRWIEAGHARGLRVAFNPAPMSDRVASYPLDLVDRLIVNEIEAAELAGTDDPRSALARLPGRSRIITLGAGGALFDEGSGPIHVAAPKVAAIDTTAAGDTFIGYFIAGQLEGLAPAAALALANQAAALCVTRTGAIDAIPHRAELRPG